MRDQDLVQKKYELAKDEYKSFGVDVEKAMSELDSINISLNCWQGDDVTGLEGTSELTGGIMSTGNYPGKARTATELRADIDKAMDLLPGTQKLNLHAMYPDFNGNKVDRDKLSVDLGQIFSLPL